MSEIGEEEIARAIARCVDDERFADAPAFRNAARAVLALLQPALERERLAAAQELMKSKLQTQKARQDAHQWELELRTCAERARREERERCLAVVNAQTPDWVKERFGPYWDGYREAMEDAAAAIRKGSGE